MSDMGDDAFVSAAIVIECPECHHRQTALLRVSGGVKLVPDK